MIPAVAIVIQQPPAPRATVVRGDSGTVAVWTERDSAWVYTVRSHENGAIRTDLSSLPRVLDSLSPAIGVSLDRAKVLRDPPVLDSTGSGAHLDYQVDHQADDIPDTPEPQYPDQFRTARLRGRVLAQFIVDSTGKPVLESFKPLLTSHWVFTLAVLAALPDMRFQPARMDGHPVAELVRIPFVFGQRANAVRVGAPNGSATVSFSHDTAWLELTTPRGTFVVHTDSFTMAAWADSAAHVRAPRPHGAKKSDYSEVVVSYPEASLSTTVAMGILRLTADSAAQFQFSGGNGSWAGELAMPYDSAQRVFAAMRGLPSTLTVWKDPWPIRAENREYRDAHFELQAKPRPGGAVPGYPEALRVQHIEGTVVAQFVVDSTGRIDISSARLLKSSHPQLGFAVYQALPSMRFFPARLNGKNIKELVQQPYAFSLTHF